MRALLVVAVLLALPAAAEDFDRPLDSGVVVIGIRASGDVGKGLTSSVGLRREDTGVLVFCVPAEPGETVTGLSEPVSNPGAPVFLRAFAFDKPDCAGLESPASADRYRVVFGAPGRPSLLPEPGT